MTSGTTPLPGSTALVTGGGTGIGAAIARGLCAVGCTVLLVGRRRGPLQATAADLAGPTTVHPCDVTDPGAVAALAATVDSDHGGIDVLVNNAGVAVTHAPGTLAAAEEEWLAAYRGNTLSAVLLRTAFAGSLERAGARVVSVGSLAARTGAASAAYVAAKAALEGWMRHDARVLGPLGATANVVAPGFTEGTELTVGRISPERRERVLATVSAGRPATPEEVAAAVVFLASPQASYVNGHVLTVDGGLRA